MCGRYLLTSPIETLRRLFGFIEMTNLAPRWNVAPTQDAPVIRQRRDPPGERTLKNLRWGLLPPWTEEPRKGPPLINARSETIQNKPAFRKPFQRRRCLVPADGFYEWTGEGKEKQAWLIQRRDREAFAFAGLWERWTKPAPEGEAPQSIDSFTIITTAANDFLRPLHERMPVMLAPEHYTSWLDPDAEAEALLPLLAPAPDALLSVVPVGPAVNSARIDEPALIAPVGEERVAAEDALPLVRPSTGSG